VTIEAVVDAQGLLTKDYVVLRLSWTRSFSTNDDASTSDLLGDNTHLFFTAASDASGAAGPIILPVPLPSSSSSSSSPSSPAASFNDVLAQGAMAGAAAAASTMDAMSSASSSSKKNKKHKKKGGGGKGCDQTGRAVYESSAVTAAASLENLVRDTIIGPILDVTLLQLQSPSSTTASYHGPVALIGNISPDTHASPTAPGARVRRRAKGELLVYVAHAAPFASAASSLVKGLQQSWARARSSCAAATGADGNASSSVEVLSYHAFGPIALKSSGASPLAFPLSMTAPLTLVAPGGTSRPGGGWVHAPGQEDERPELMAVRRALHERLRLPLNRPFFRSTCALRLAPPAPSAAAIDDDDENTGKGPQRLQDVHLGLPPSSVAGGTRHLVDGSYLFYHYLQDRVDDKGWGCAYRSLQTLVSFFRLSHYTTEPVPSHREIQQVLVNIGDKNPGFVGSREWIGSMEVGFFLDQALGLQWRSVSAPSGPELAERAAELAAHFDDQGTPVMMGGGSLAFTLLGVEWNEATGEVAFLILDPHYTGPEDLQSVQSKEVALEGYRATACGWRSPASFARNSFFNLCLPQRPNLY